MGPRLARPTGYAASRIRAWAVIGAPGEAVEVDLLRAELQYYLNAIPEATLHVAVGREVRSLQPSMAHQLIGRIMASVPIRVFVHGLEPDPERAGDPAGTPWPKEPFSVFFGYITEAMFDSAREGGTTLKLRCVHWLAQLNFAWTWASQLSVDNARDDTQRLTRDAVITGAAAHVPGGINAATVQQDFWGAALRPWLVRIAQQEPRILGLPLLLHAGNAAAEQALTRFEPTAKGYQRGVPLQFHPNIPVPRRLAANIAAYCANTLAQQFTDKTSFWALLLSIAKSFALSVVPLAETAILAPVVPGLAPRPDLEADIVRVGWQVIYPEEYTNIRLNNVDLEARPPLRGVLCVHNEILYDSGRSPREHIGGFFLADQAGGAAPALAAGRVELLELPAWAGNVIFPLEAAYRIQKGSMAGGPLGVDPKELEGNVTPANMRQQLNKLWEAWARWEYQGRVFRSRQCSVQGKVRFDIAPGSNICVVVLDEKFVTTATREARAQGREAVDAGTLLYGLVGGVIIVLDSEKKQSYTELALISLRNADEIRVPAFGLVTHPLWAHAFLGATLAAVSPPLLANFKRLRVVPE